MIRGYASGPDYLDGEERRNAGCVPEALPSDVDHNPPEILQRRDQGPIMSL